MCAMQLIDLNNDQWTKEYKRLLHLKTKLTSLTPENSQWLQRRIQLMQLIQHEEDEDEF